MMQLCLGVLGVSSIDFWKLTPIEFWEMNEGYRLANDVDDNSSGMTKEELEVMIKEDNKRMENPEAQKLLRQNSKKLRRMNVR